MRPLPRSALTVLMPSPHGLRNSPDNRLMDRGPEAWSVFAAFNTIPRAFKTAGYVTGMFGKFHLGVLFAPQLGFAYWITMPNGPRTSFCNSEIIDHGRR